MAIFSNSSWGCKDGSCNKCKGEESFGELHFEGLFVFGGFNVYMVMVEKI
jgi:hypothetical protein